MAQQLAAGSVALLTALTTSVTLALTTPSFTPLNDLGAGLYNDQFQGGLYPGGSNVMPFTHHAAGRATARHIWPRDVAGNPDLDGSYALLSIGMSNTTQEFCSGNSQVGCAAYSFMGQAAVHPVVNTESLVIVNGAKGGKSAAFWDSPDDEDYDRVRDQVLSAEGLTEQQVAAAWVKVANPRPEASLPEATADAYLLVEQMGNIARALKTRYPNIQQAYYSSRIYAGYATTMKNPEPYAYESGFAVKWLIEAQINQMNGGGIDPIAGNLNYLDGTAPWLAWGPYMWADGLNPRSDGLTWEPGNFNNDGTHPSETGREKVGVQLLNFFLSDPHSQSWFLSASAGDFNGDGEIDGRDFLMWQRGESYDPLSNTDLAIWQAQYGTPPLTANSTAVPEPATLALCLALALSIGIRRCQINDSVLRDGQL